MINLTWYKNIGSLLDVLTSLNKWLWTYIFGVTEILLSIKVFIQYKNYRS